MRLDHTTINFIYAAILKHNEMVLGKPSYTSGQSNVKLARKYWAQIGRIRFESPEYYMICVWTFADKYRISNE